MKGKLSMYVYIDMKHAANDNDRLSRLIKELEEVMQDFHEYRCLLTQTLGTSRESELSPKEDLERMFDINNKVLDKLDRSKQLSRELSDIMESFKSGESGKS